MRTCSRLIESPQSKGADVTGLVVARCDCDMFDGAGADEAHLGFVNGRLSLLFFGDWIL